MDHFTNIKVKGVSDESGSKYDIGEHTCLTLRQCKVLVSENRVRHFADSREEVVVDAVEDRSERKPETWACVDPCALLILLADTTDPEVRRTLDAYGWITQDGELDDEQANDNYEKWEIKSK